MSCSSVDSDSLLNEDRLNSFPLPLPPIQLHPLDDIQYPTILTKLRELLIMCRQKLTALEPRREGSSTSLMDMSGNTSMAGKVVDIKVTSKKKVTLASVSSSSQTSLDSTGSSSLADQDKRGVQPENALSGSDDGEGKKSPTSPASPSTPDGGAVVANGHAAHIVNGHNNEEGGVVINGEDRVTTDRIDHVTTTTAITNAGERLSISVTDSPTVKKRPISLYSLEQQHGLEVSSRNGRDSARNTPQPHDRLSLTSEDRISDSGSASPASMRRQQRTSSPRELIRRQTCPSGMYPGGVKRSSTISSPSPSGSRRYAKTSVPHPTNSLPARTHSISGKVKIRRNPSAAARMSTKRRASSHKSHIAGTTTSPTNRLVKVLLTGNDNLVSHVAKAYAHLRLGEPNLLSGMELRFYHVPLSRASLIHTQFSDLARSSLAGQHGGGGGGGGAGTSDLPEPMFEQINLSGNDVHIGRFMAHMDSWYERNVMMAVHHLLRLIPSVSSSSFFPTFFFLSC